MILQHPPTVTDIARVSSPMKQPKTNFEPYLNNKPRNALTANRPTTAQPRASQNPVKNSLVPAESKYNNYTNDDRNPDNLNAKDVEINSLKEIIAALNQKLKKTEDLESEIIEVRNTMMSNEDAREILRQELEGQNLKIKE